MQIQNKSISCDHCGHQIKGNAKFCPMCGGELAAPLNLTKPTCPRCQEGLEDYVYRGRSLAKCPACNGIWLDYSDFNRLTTEIDVYRDGSVEPDFIRQPRPKVDRYFPCAKCGNLMLRKNFAGVSNIMIDFCRDCGIWLDANELKSIREFIASGGLEQAQDKILAEHSTEIGLLDARVSDLKFMEKILNSKSLKRWFFASF